MIFILVIVDYIANWVKVDPFTNSTNGNRFKFIWKNINCWFRIPNSIILDNGTPFQGEKLKVICE